jgi:hypothetical protein
MAKIEWFNKYKQKGNPSSSFITIEGINDLKDLCSSTTSIYRFFGQIGIHYSEI